MIAAGVISRLFFGFVAAVGWAAVASVKAVALWLFVIARSAAGEPMTDLMLLQVVQTRFPAVYGALGPRGPVHARRARHAN